MVALIGLLGQIVVGMHPVFFQRGGFITSISDVKIMSLIAVGPLTFLSPVGAVVLCCLSLFFEEI